MKLYIVFYLVVLIIIFSKYKKKYGEQIISIKGYDIKLEIALDMLVLTIIGFGLIAVNFLPKHQWCINFDKIALSKDIIQLILLVTETIFVKTTVLAGVIITGLFKDANKFGIKK